MSDLHSRIAAVATNHQIDLEGADWWECSCGHRFSIHDDNYLTWDEHMADAVIAELGLREERTETETLTNEQGATWFRQGCYRYVTDWRADDE